MKVMIKRISICKCLVPLALGVALFMARIPVPALANPGLTVSDAGILAIVNPGQTLTHTMTVTIDSDDAATDISVEVAGLQQLPNGGYEFLVDCI